MSATYNEGYHVQVCTCVEGPHIGCRKTGTPDCCERCGYLTPAQRDSMLVQFFSQETTIGKVLAESMIATISAAAQRGGER